ncbi:unnamed protein product, partial [Mesorhabditis spiculigera]
MHNSKKIAFLAVCQFVILNVDAFRLQGIAVKGRLLCNEKVLRNTRVKIYDIDRNPGDSDDLLDDRYTDKDGEFRVFGTTRELTDIEPVLYVYHDCEDGIRPCQKRVRIDIPPRWIVRKKEAAESDYYDVGTLRLETPYPNEDRSCEN